MTQNPALNLLLLLSLVPLHQLHSGRGSIMKVFLTKITTEEASKGHVSGGTALTAWSQSHFCLEHKDILHSAPIFELPMLNRSLAAVSVAWKLERPVGDSLNTQQHYSPSPCRCQCLFNRDGESRKNPRSNFQLKLKAVGGWLRLKAIHI